jgi:hypothetical protein
VNIPKSNVLSEIGERWTEKWFDLVFKGLTFYGQNDVKCHITEISLSLLLEKLELRNELSLFHCQ